MSGDGGFVLVNEEQYSLRLPNGNLLPEVWVDIYEWFAGGMAPKSGERLPTVRCQKHFQRLIKLKRR